MTKERTSLVAALALLVVAGWLGISAVRLLSFAGVASAYNAALDLGELNYRQLTVGSFVNLRTNDAMVRSLLAVAAVIPIPALLRIATSGGKRP